MAPDTLFDLLDRCHEIHLNVIKVALVHRLSPKAESFAALAASGVLTFVRSRVLNVVSMAFCAAMPDANVSSKYCAMR